MSVLYVSSTALVPSSLRHRLTALIIKRTGLFDAEYYLRVNSDVAASGQPPLLHYVRYGDREGRCPMPLFDPRFYRTRAGKGSHLMNSLLHYAWIGRYSKLSPSSWFDSRYYLQHNRDVERRGFDPLRHYLRWGGLEGRSPNPSFNGRFYLHAYPDVQTARVNPLIHYVEHGRFHGMTTALDTGKAPATETEPTQTEAISKPGAWDVLECGLSNGTRDGQPSVAVVIPVYRDRQLTWRCLASVLTAPCEIPFRIVVIDDASPEPELSADLAEMARRGWIELLRNERNMGFVVSVNRGIAAAGELDVVLLNADTEVYGNWLDRLRTAAQRHPRTATVTPLSNNATICSYPRFLHDNPYSLETDYETLDRLTARVNAGYEVEAPTGVGFCMYLRRDALADVGLFDEAAFGKGYGEENDLCQRAIRRGWRNVIVADVFVRHLGGASFQGEKGKRVAVAMKVMARRHPGYQQAVEEFIRRDPLAEARQRLDWERVRNRARNENVLIVCHNRGGGAERHVQEDTQRLREEGKGVFYLRPERSQPTYARIGHPACRQLLNLRSYKLANTKALAAALKELRITRIHSHGLVDFTADAPDHLLALAQALDVPLHVDIHDYKVICPRVNLADQNGRYCNEPEEEKCDACLITQGNDFGVVNIRRWRKMHSRVLMAAEAVWVPDEDVAERLARYYPQISCHVTPHETIDAAALQVRVPSLQPRESLRVVVIGGISKIKGYHVLLACARDARKRRLPIKFIVMGYSVNDLMLEKAGVLVSGRYLEHEAEERLHSLAPHAVWLPSVWPETYSYTLSLALKAGYPVFAFDIGAIGRRLREVGQSDNVWPLALASMPVRINARLMKYRDRHLLKERNPLQK